jgi:ABC-type transporter Mla subunit MlaD
MMSGEWLPVGSLGVVSSIAAWLVSWRVSAARTDGRRDAERASETAKDSSIKEDIHALRDEVRDAVGEIRSVASTAELVRTRQEEVRATVAELRALAGQTAKLQASQDVVNNVTAKTLENVVAKLDRHDEKLTDHASTLKLITEVVMSRSKVLPPGPCPTNCPFGPAVEQPKGGQA